MRNLYKAIFAGAIALMGTVPQQAQAEDIRYIAEDFTYIIHTDGNYAGIAAVTSTEAEITLPDFVTYEDTEYPVTRIESAGVCGVATMEELTLGNNIEAILTAGIYVNAKLTTINFNDKLTSIGDMGLGFNFALTTCVIPPSVQSIGKDVLINDVLMGGWQVSEESPYFKAVDGKLFSKDGTKFVDYPSFMEIAEDYTVPEGIKEICGGCFSGLANLKTVVLPEGLEYIGSEAFKGTSITEVTFPASMVDVAGDAFMGCAITSYSVAPGSENLKMVDGWVSTADNKRYILSVPRTGDVVIPEGVEELGAFSLYGTAATSLTLPNSMRRVGKSACYRGSLEKLELGEGIEVIDSMAFVLNKIKTLNLPQSMRRLEYWSFLNNEQLEELTLNEGLEYIGGHSFYQNFLLKHVEVPGTVKFLGDACFYQTGLEELVLGEGITRIDGNMAFSHNTNLSKITFPETLEYIGENAFQENGMYSCVLPMAVKHIGYNAFGWMSNCTSFSAPGVEYLGTRAFQACWILKDIDLGDNLKEIGEYAFVGVVTEDFTLPATIEKLGYQALASMDQLCTLKVKSEVPPTIGEGEDGVQLFNPVRAPEMYARVVLSVPEGSEDLYRAADCWKDFEIMETLSGVSNDVIKVESSVEAIYDQNGLRVNAPVPGVNIIRYNNGTVSKVIIP